MSGEPVLIRVDGDGGHGELMGRSEDSDGDFLVVKNMVGPLVKFLPR